MDQFETVDRVDHRQAADFNRWISLLYRTPGTRFCTVSVGSLGLPTVAATLRFGVGDSPSPAEGHGSLALRGISVPGGV